MGAEVAQGDDDLLYRLTVVFSLAHTVDRSHNIYMSDFMGWLRKVYDGHAAPSTLEGGWAYTPPHGGALRLMLWQVILGHLPRNATIPGELPSYERVARVVQTQGARRTAERYLAALTVYRLGGGAHAAE